MDEYKEKVKTAIYLASLIIVVLIIAAGQIKLMPKDDVVKNTKNNTAATVNTTSQPNNEQYDNTTQTQEITEIQKISDENIDNNAINQIEVINNENNMQEIVEAQNTQIPVYNDIKEEETRPIEEVNKNDTTTENKQETINNDATAANTDTNNENENAIDEEELLRGYKISINKKVYRNWKQLKNYPNKIVIVDFVIDKDGNLISSQIVESSKVSTVDNSALNAIRNSSPFEKYTGTLIKKSKIKMRYTFSRTQPGVEIL